MSVITLARSSISVFLINLGKAKEFSSSIQDSIDLTFDTILCCIFIPNYSLISSCIARIEPLVSQSTNPTLTNSKLSAFKCLVALDQGLYKDAAKHAISIDFSTPFDEFVTRSELALISILCSLATSDRKELIKLSESRELASVFGNDMFQSIKLLVSFKYSACLEIVAKLIVCLFNLGSLQDEFLHVESFTSHFQKNPSKGSDFLPLSLQYH